MCISVLASCQEKSLNQPPSPDPTTLLADLKWIDLTHSFDSTTLYWPNNLKSFELEVESKGVTDLGYFYSSNSLSTPEHGGTHLDAPIHFSANGKTVEELTLDQLMGNAVLIDVSEKALADRDYQIDSVAVLTWEKENGLIPENTIVLFHTGYGAFYPDRERYFGTSKIGLEAIPELHFPGIDPAGAKFLAQKRKIKAVGIDTPSLDFGQSKDFAAHQELMRHHIPGFENVANLDQLPSKDLFVIALPMKIKSGSGGPLRIIAGVKVP